MTEQVYLVALVVIGLCFLGVITLAILALCIGRPLRAEGRARLGTQGEFTFDIKAEAQSDTFLEPRESSQHVTFAPICSPPPLPPREEVCGTQEILISRDNASRRPPRGPSA